MAGYAPFGSGVGNLALDLRRPAADFLGLDAAAFDGYVTGLCGSASASRAACYAWAGC
jgi:hypothetical protein